MALNSRSHFINELVELLGQAVIILQRLSCLSDKVLSIVVGDRIDTPIVVGLRLVIDHAIGGLETDFQFAELSLVHLGTHLAEVL